MNIRAIGSQLTAEHRLWGTPKQLWYVVSSMREKYPESSLHILVAKANSGSFTYDGIERGGERVCYELEEEIERLARRGQVIRKLSVVGYSLGGLVARYAVGLLDSKGFFDEVKPIVSSYLRGSCRQDKLISKQNFTTFATPHLGVRTPLLGLHNHLW